MMEVIWVSIFGAALAWLQSQTTAGEQTDAEAPIDDEWRRWEEEIYDWRDQ